MRLRKTRAWVEFQTSGRVFILPGKFKRALESALPKWLLWLMLVLRFIPTPFEVDEWAPLLLILILMAVQWGRIRRYRAGWRGGKSHRAFDARLAVA